MLSLKLQNKILYGTKKFWLSNNMLLLKTRAHKNGQLEKEHVTPIEAHNWDKIRTLVTCTLSNINIMAYFYAAC